MAAAAIVATPAVAPGTRPTPPEVLTDPLPVSAVAGESWLEGAHASGRGISEAGVQIPALRVRQASFAASGILAVVRLPLALQPSRLRAEAYARAKEAGIRIEPSAPLTSCLGIVSCLEALVDRPGGSAGESGLSAEALDAAGLRRPALPSATATMPDASGAAVSVARVEPVDPPLLPGRSAGPGREDTGGTRGGVAPSGPAAGARAADVGGGEVRDLRLAGSVPPLVAPAATNGVPADTPLHLLRHVIASTVTLDLSSTPVGGDSWLDGTVIDFVAMQLQDAYPGACFLPTDFAAFSLLRWAAAPALAGGPTAVAAEAHGQNGGSAAAAAPPPPPSKDMPRDLLGRRLVIGPSPLDWRPLSGPDACPHPSVPSATVLRRAVPPVALIRSGRGRHATSAAWSSSSSLSSSSSSSAGAAPAKRAGAGSGAVAAAKAAERHFKAAQKAGEADTSDGDSNATLESDADDGMRGSASGNDDDDDHSGGRCGGSGCARPLPPAPAITADWPPPQLFSSPAARVVVAPDWRTSAGRAMARAERREARRAARERRAWLAVSAAMGARGGVHALLCRAVRERRAGAVLALLPAVAGLPASRAEALRSEFGPVAVEEAAMRRARRSRRLAARKRSSLAPKRPRTQSSETPSQPAAPPALREPAVAGAARPSPAPAGFAPGSESEPAFVSLLTRATRVSLVGLVRIVERGRVPDRRAVAKLAVRSLVATGCTEAHATVALAELFRAHWPEDPGLMALSAAQGLSRLCPGRSDIELGTVVLLAALQAPAHSSRPFAEILINCLGWFGGLERQAANTALQPHVQAFASTIAADITTTLRGMGAPVPAAAAAAAAAPTVAPPTVAPALPAARLPAPAPRERAAKRARDADDASACPDVARPLACTVLRQRASPPVLFFWNPGNNHWNLIRVQTAPVPSIEVFEPFG